VYHQRHLAAQAGQRALEEAQRLLGQARTRASETARTFGSLIPADKWDKPINHFSSDLRRHLGKHTRATELERELRSLGQAVINPMLDLRAPARPNALAVREQVHHLVRLFAPATPALEGYRRSLRDGATLPPILLENLHYDASNLTMYLMDPIQLFTRIPEWERELEQAMRDWEGLMESASYSAARPGAGARETRDLAEELRTPVGNRIRKLACALTEAQAALAFPWSPDYRDIAWSTARQGTYWSPDLVVQHRRLQDLHAQVMDVWKMPRTFVDSNTTVVVRMVAKAVCHSLKKVASRMT